MSDSPNDPTNPEDPTVGGPNGPSGTGPEPTGAEQDAGSDPVLPGAPVGHLGPDGTTEVIATEAGDRNVTLVDRLGESEVDRVSQNDLNQEMQRTYLDSAMSVIDGGAVPEVRHGLRTRDG